MTKKTYGLSRLAALTVAAAIAAMPMSLTASADSVPKIALNMEMRIGDTVDFGENGTYMYKDVNPGEAPKRVVGKCRKHADGNGGQHGKDAGGTLG